MTTMSRDIKRFTIIMEAFRPDSKMGHDEVRRVVEDAVAEVTRRTPAHRV